MPAPRVRLVVAAAVAAALLGAAAAWVASRLVHGPDELSAQLTPPSSPPVSAGALPVPAPRQPGPPPAGLPGGPPQAGPPAPPPGPPLGPQAGQPPAVASGRSVPPVPADPSGPREITPRDAALAGESPSSRCVSFQNTSFAVPVRITGVGLAGAGLALDPQDCAGSSGISTGPVCSPGVTLDPGGDGCIAGVRATTTEPADYTGTVRLRLAAHCTATEAPCDAPELAADPPSPGRPADVTWTDPGYAVCVRVPAPAAAAGTAASSCS